MSSALRNFGTYIGLGNIDFGLTTPKGWSLNDANQWTNNNMQKMNQNGMRKMGPGGAQKTGEYTGMDYLGAGLQTLDLIGGLYTGWRQLQLQKENNKLQKEAFEFNKDMSLKNFDLAKEDHDRRVAKSEAVSRQYAASNDEWKKRNAKIAKQRALERQRSELARANERNRINEIGA